MTNQTESLAAQAAAGFDEARFIGSLTGQAVRPAAREPAPDDKPGVRLAVCYNGRACELQPDEAVAYAQKGMNYDHVLAERDAARARAAALEEELGAWQEGDGADEQDTLERNWLEFIESHPEVRDPLSELPEEVWQEIEAGQSPCAAFLAHENRRLSARAEALQQALDATGRRESARAKSPGSVRSMATPPASGDPFLEGLLQGFSR
ncbi:MAG: hypothetical protein RRY21_02435 [Oscillospiraceae bacterium]